MHVERNVPYLEPAEERQTLDIYRPAAHQPVAAAPVVVFFYGGSWQFGSKAQYAFVAEAFTSAGYVVVIPDYRLYPNVRFPDFLHDSAAALSWVYHNISSYGGNVENLFLLGHSAGAYNAAMLATDTRYLGAHNLTPDIIKAFAGLAGPYDFIPLQDPVLRSIFAVNGNSDDPVIEPINHIGTHTPPMFLSWGKLDRVVWRHNAANMHRALQEQGIRSSHKEYSLTTHLTIIGGLAPGYRWLAPVRQDILAFFDAHK